MPRIQDGKSSREPFDVVVVPDFSGAAWRTFEVRALYFLASWMQNAGEARAYPLHLACIGQPPATVRHMVERAGAGLTVHQPLRAGDGVTCNKIRGLQISGRTDRVLLLDADVLVLSDIGGLAALGALHGCDHGPVALCARSLLGPDISCFGNAPDATAYALPMG